MMCTTASSWTWNHCKSRWNITSLIYGSTELYCNCEVWRQTFARLMPSKYTCREHCAHAATWNWDVWGGFEGGCAEQRNDISLNILACVRAHDTTKRPCQWLFDPYIVSIITTITSFLPLIHMHFVQEKYSSSTQVRGCPQQDVWNSTVLPVQNSQWHFCRWLTKRSANIFA